MNKLSPATIDAKCRMGSLSISRLASLAVVLILSMPAIGGCRSADSNPLIGSWKYSGPAGVNQCTSTSVFNEKMAILSYPATPALPNNPYSTATPARTANVPVIRYMPSPTLVVLLTGGQGYPTDSTNYNFVDRNHMWTETAYGKCTYERTN